MLKYFNKPKYYIITPIFFIMLGVFLSIIVFQLTAPNQTLYLVLLIIFFCVYFAYFIWWLLSSIEFVSFSKQGIHIVNIFHKINIDWQTLLSANIQNLLTAFSPMGRIFKKWIVVKTSEAQICKSLSSGLNKKTGPYFILANENVVKEMRKHLFYYRKDINLDSIAPND